MATTAALVDDAGIHVPAGMTGSVDLVVDEHRVWSSAIPEDGEVDWPRALRRILTGTGRVRLVDDQGQTLFDDVVVFAGSAEPIDLTDRYGNLVIVDKWGLIQRPLDSRRDAGVVELMVDTAEALVQTLREECGIEAWLGFGTLLGAAREGKAIGHDSDIDLCYLSEQPTPSLMALELWSIARALRAAGFTIDMKSGTFITVIIDAPDGGIASIDLYTTFFLGGLLYETATVRAPVPRSAVLPLGTIEFEGRRFAAPADVDALLQASYGPSWRVPDPSFEHRPGREVVRRFDGWFGSLMRGRREWRRVVHLRAEAGAGPSDFARFVHERIEPGTRISDIGMGSGADVAYWAEQGHHSVGFDYTVPPSVRRRVRAGGGVPRNLNLYDLRDVLVRGALLTRGGRPEVVCVRGVLEALHPDGLDNLWYLVRAALRSGGHLYLEGRAMAPDVAARSSTEDSGPLRSYDPVQALAELDRSGAVVEHREGLDDARRAVRGGPPATWRIVASFPDRYAEVGA